MRRLAALILAMLLACGALPPSARAETPAAAALELRSRLDRVLDLRDEAQSALDGLKQDLARIDQDMAQAEQESLSLAEQERQIAQRLPQVRREIQELQPQVQRQRALLVGHLRALYLFGPEASQALLASSKDFHDVLSRSQTLAWLLEADQRRLSDLAQRSRRLSELQAQMALQQNEIQEVRQRLEEQQQRLSELRLARLKASQEMSLRQKALEQNLAALREAEARLARTFTLAPAPERARAPQANQPPAAPGILGAKGRLALPVEGRLLTSAQSAQRGVIWEARPGSSVRSPWNGTVVHAGHLAGYGQVVVVDHGQRVHTVLAHLGTLAVEAGQQVVAGQALGTVDTNGRLYLEVRREARPENPMEWLRLRP